MTKTEILYEVGKATPPLSLAATKLLGYTLADWVFALGGLLLLLQLGFLIYDRVKKRGRK